MLKVLVASSKGGCGKTTLATNLAAHYAADGKRTVIVDADRQGSSQRWCEKRVLLGGIVLPVDGTRRGWQQRIPADAQRVVIDTPAGIRASEIADWIDDVNVIVVPVLPSTIDLEASAAFLAELADLPRIKRGKVAVGLVANRLKPWTSASQQALDQIKQLPFPLVAQIRDTQAYVLLAGLGKSIFDYHSEQVRSHQDDWAKLLRWIKRQ
ncbi:ParA family protein [Dokdonella koreensis]|uniref:Partition protein n=1 Tax=Dokdonella koreensis DS-123 TaxID=1300342 RepID=A0A167G535_9GAMM|nr:ParA family protein [Dokdonella koreensis]ANB16167.1 partition protein [Dokdonella koreensis DS-123]